MDKRNELINKTVNKINKQFKKEVATTLFKAFDPGNVKIFVPTGNLALDFVIGRPGFPVGRITEISGVYSSGKCIVEGTKILYSNNKFVNIEDCCPGDKIYNVDVDNNVAYFYDEIEDVFYRGKQEVFLVTLDNGMEIEITENHPLLFLNNKKNKIEWSPLKNIKKNDFIAIPECKYVDYYTGKNKIDDLSLLVYELMLAEKYGNVDILNLFHNIYKNINLNYLFILFFIHHENFRLEKYIIEDNLLYTLKFYSKNKKFLQHFQLILHYYMCCPSKIKKQKSNSFYLEISNINFIKKICKQIKNNKIFDEILENILIDNDKLNEIKNNINIDVLFDDIYNKNLNFNYLDDYLFFHKYRHFLSYVVNIALDNIEDKDIKQIIRKEIKNSRQKNTYFESVYKIDKDHILGTNILEDLQKINNSYCFIKIKNIKTNGIKDTWDLSIKNNHNFIANGIHVHNSTISAMSLAQAQKAGMVTILIDAEHSYDKDWSVKYGVDPELLILMQPTHLQEAFDYLRTLITIVEAEKSDVPIMAVFDSVSASPTSQELAEEDSSAGKQRAIHAKVISEGLRKMVDTVWNNNMALVFISQLKDNPGIMYGSGKHKLGGAAIDFHASLLLQTKIINRVKKNGVPISQVVQIKSTKNKFVPPFRTANFEINYLTGINNKYTALLFMIKLGWIKKSGGWIVLENGDKIRPRDAVDSVTDEQINKLYEYFGLLYPYNKDNADNFVYNLSGNNNEDDKDDKDEDYEEEIVNDPNKD